MMELSKFYHVLDSPRNTEYELDNPVFRYSDYILDLPRLSDYRAGTVIYHLMEEYCSISPVEKWSTLQMLTTLSEHFIFSPDVDKCME